MLYWHLIHIKNTRKSSRLYPAMLLNGLEDTPAPVTVALIASQAEGDEEGFNGLRAMDEQNKQRR